jgi:hypothetical protein
MMMVIVVAQVVVMMLMNDKNDDTGLTRISTSNSSNDQDIRLSYLENNVNNNILNISSNNAMTAHNNNGDLDVDGSVVQ